jgi:microcystin-dependent protein
MFGGNFAPRGWALCNGQLLSIAQNTALFSLLGTTYGGDGITTFALPDLRGRVPMHAGQGPGLTDRLLGERSGEESHVLTTDELPTHRHGLFADTAVATLTRPGTAFIARNAAGIPAFGSAGIGYMALGSVGYTGENQPHNTMQPYLTVNFIIALTGIYPPRD